MIFINSQLHKLYSIYACFVFSLIEMGEKNAFINYNLLVFVFINETKQTKFHWTFVIGSALQYL